MPRHFYGTNRMTNRYVGSCQHLDKWDRTDHVFKELGSPKYFYPKEDSGMEDGGIRQLIVIAPTHIAEHLIRTWLHNEYSSEGCACTRDCCGCSSYRPEIKKMRRNRHWLVRVHISLNY